MGTGNFPIFKTQLGKVSGAVFSGQYGYSVIMQKRIYNKEKQETRYEKMYVAEADLLNLAYVATKVLDWLLLNPEQKPQSTPEPENKTTTNDSENISF